MCGQWRASIAQRPRAQRTQEVSTVLQVTYTTYYLLIAILFPIASLALDVNLD